MDPSVFDGGLAGACCCRSGLKSGTGGRLFSPGYASTGGGGGAVAVSNSSGVLRFMFSMLENDEKTEVKFDWG